MHCTKVSFVLYVISFNRRHGLMESKITIDSISSLRDRFKQNSEDQRGKKRVAGVEVRLEKRGRLLGVLVTEVGTVS